MLSTPSKYALRALMWLGTKSQTEFYSVRAIARGAKVPEPYLSKLMKKLAARKIVETKKGVGGGVRLKKDKVTFFEVCKVLGDPVISEYCMLSNKKCNKGKPCHMHSVWSREQNRIHSFLKRSAVVS